ncbi:hypothetical protein P5V15_006630 [Pogonomyrmex californicus]
MTPFRVALSYHLPRRTGITQYRKHRDKPTTCARRRTAKEAPVDCIRPSSGHPRGYRPRARIIVAVNYDLNPKTDTKPPTDVARGLESLRPLSSRTSRAPKKTDVCFRLRLKPSGYLYTNWTLKRL